MRRLQEHGTKLPERVPRLPLPLRRPPRAVIQLLPQCTHLSSELVHPLLAPPPVVHLPLALVERALLPAPRDADFAEGFRKLVLGFGPCSALASQLALRLGCLCASDIQAREIV